MVSVVRFRLQQCQVHNLQKCHALQVRPWPFRLNSARDAWFHQFMESAYQSRNGTECYRLNTGTEPRLAVIFLPLVSTKAFVTISVKTVRSQILKSKSGARVLILTRLFGQCRSPLYLGHPLRRAGCILNSLRSEAFGMSII